MGNDLIAHWDGDALERKPIANFLHRYLVKKYEASTLDESICFALDGDWGTGKTFFITKWAEDIEKLQHPVVRFDAWKNDLSDQPLMGFVGSLQNGLKPWQEKIPVGQSVAKQGKTVSRKMLKRAGRALIPVSGFVAKALVKKLSGIGLDELMDLLTESGDDETIETESNTREKIRDGALDKLFEASVEEHANRIRAIDELKDSVRELLEYLEEKHEARLPMFVFIDELDRCRPNYAIELLEGVKHLFDVRGLCFCFSTNVTQLSESIKGVYGGGFDASRYLKRFFSFEYVLPEPMDEAYVSRMISGSLLSERKKIFSGLVGFGNDDPGVLSKTFHFVARSFNLDLRSQRQVFGIADAASAGIDADTNVHLLFLFSLSALRHLDRRTFDRLETEGIEIDAVKASLESLLDPTYRHSYQCVRYEDSGRGRRESTDRSLGSILRIYVDVSNRDLKEIRDHRPNSDHGNYPSVIWDDVAAEMPQSYYRNQSYIPSIRGYYHLVRTAGQIVNREKRTIE